MRNFFMGNNVFNVIVGGLGLLKDLREERFTWRSALLWIGWAITTVLAVAAAVDSYREKKELRRLE